MSRKPRKPTREAVANMAPPAGGTDALMVHADALRMLRLSTFDPLLGLSP